MTYVSPLPANQVLVTVGTGFGFSSQGSSETQHAAMINDPRMIGFAAFDARLVDIDLDRSTAKDPIFTRRDGDAKGQPISLEGIEGRWGNRLRENMGIRFLSQEKMAAHVPTDIGAPLAHQLENVTGEGSLRQRLGFQFADLQDSPLKPMAPQFQDNDLGPSLQSLLFGAGMGALSALPEPLYKLCPHAFRFQVAAGTCFSGQESGEALRKSLSMLKKEEGGDEAARRLAAFLNTHGPALNTRQLSPSFPLQQTQKRIMKDPHYMRRLKAPGDPYGRRNVPRAPLVVSAACATAFMSFCGIAPYLEKSGSFNGIDMALWLSADAALSPEALVLEGFGPTAMMSRAKLAKSGRPVSECLAPFDEDALGTVVGNGGYGIIVTTLEYAIRHFLDITSIIVGYGNSSETGGNAHSAGVGWGGGNAVIDSYIMAWLQHGYTVNDFGHKIAHATGTNINSKTDLGGFTEDRLTVAEVQGLKEKLIRMTVGATKTKVGHEMSPAGHRATEEGTYYLLGEPTVGVPTFRQLEKRLERDVEYYDISPNPVPGNANGGTEEDVQGFGGYVAAMLRRSANRQSISRYRSSVDPSGYARDLEAYLEMWPQIRQERTEREAKARRSIGAVRRLVEKHRWRGDDE